MSMDSRQIEAIVLFCNAREKKVYEQFFCFLRGLFPLE